MSRTNWKGFYIDPKDLKKLNLSKKHKINIMSRNSEIVPQFLDLSFKIYNGKNYVEILITDDMIGHKFGEFVFTRSRFTFKKKKSKK